MAIIGFIVLGDRTSHDGTVIACSTNRYINGVRVARLGDLVICPRCKRATKIITSRFPQCKDDGIPATFDMDVTDCGAQIYSRHNGYAGYGDDADPGANATKTRPNARTNPPPSDDAPSVQEHFVLRHSDTDKPLADMAYTLDIADGRTIEGDTDEQGRTNVVWTHAPDDMTVSLNPPAGKSNDPYHFPESSSKET